MHRLAIAALAIAFLPTLACAVSPTTNAPPKAIPVVALPATVDPPPADLAPPPAAPAPPPANPAADLLKGIPLSYEITEIGLTLKLPPQWTALPAASIEVMNNIARTKMPTAKFSYIAGYERDNSMSQPTDTSYPTYILIQKTPFTSGMTPQKILEMFPTVLKPVVVKTLLDANRWGETWLNESIPAIVVNGPEPGLATGTNVTIVRAYEIVTDQNLIGVNVYCRSDAGHIVFSEIEHILSGMILSDEAHPPGNWVEEIKKLNNLPPPKTQTAAVPAPTSPQNQQTPATTPSPAQSTSTLPLLLAKPPKMTDPVQPHTPLTPPPYMSIPPKMTDPVKPSNPLPSSQDLTTPPYLLPHPDVLANPAPPQPPTVPPLTMQTTPAAILSAHDAPPPTSDLDQPMPDYPSAPPLPAIFHPVPPATSPH